MLQDKFLLFPQAMRRLDEKHNSSGGGGSFTKCRVNLQEQNTEPKYKPFICHKILTHLLAFALGLILKDILKLKLTH